jgi:hypothetical protein
VVYGVSADFAMSRLDDEVHPEMHLFVEDREAEVLLREILASSGDTGGLLQRIAINAVGASNVVAMLGGLGKVGKLPYRSLAIVDGDHIDDNCLSLPGTLAPERMVYADLKAKDWPNLSLRFGIGAGTLLTALEDAMLEPDHHKWNAKVGDQILKSSAIVWEVLANEWCKSCLDPNSRKTLADAIAIAADAA